MPRTPPPPLAACQPSGMPVSRSPLPARFGFTMQLAALQKPVPAQAASDVQVVPQVGCVPDTQRNPLQLCVVIGAQVPAPLQTFIDTMLDLVSSQAGVESQTCVAP